VVSLCPNESANAVLKLVARLSTKVALSVYAPSNEIARRSDSEIESAFDWETENTVASVKATLSE
jgi:hypothetical protein